MSKPYKTCDKGYEYYFNKHIKGEITESEWKKWYNEHCGICKHFSGYHCAYGEICPSSLIGRTSDLRTTVQIRQRIPEGE